MKLQSKSGSPESNRKKIGSVSWDQVKIASDKMQDMNAFTVDAAMSMVRNCP
jgi:large subunit ribosomal protein L11